MNYLLTLLTPDNTGGARVALEYASALVENGDNVLMVHGATDVSPKRCEAYLQEVRQAGISLHEEKGLNSVFPIMVVQRLTTLAKENNINSVIGVNQRDRPIAVSVAKKIGVLSIVCGLNQHKFFGSLWTSKAKKYYYGYWMRRADLLVCSSQEVFDEYVNWFRVKPDRLALLPHGISINDRVINESDSNHLREEFDIAEDCFVIANVGRIDPQKGQDILLEAVKKIQIHKPIRIILVGAVNAGNSEAENRKYEEKLRVLAECDELRGVVKFAGWRDDIEQIFSISDVYCHPARYEGLPLTVLMALASKTPVIVSANSASPPGFINAVHGLHIEPESVSDCAGKLSSFSEMTSQQTMGMASNGRRLVESDFNMSKIGLRFCNLLNRKDYLRRL